MWYLPNDASKGVITADEQINSAHHACHLHLPNTAIVFFMSKGTDYLAEHYDAEEMEEPFPRFLNRCPIWEIKDLKLCFLDGGRGAPQATDAVYRQTFGKERLWREKGAVGVDMETSAVFSVARYLGLKAIALLMVSDIHPIRPNAPKWEWHMTRDMKYQFAEQGIVLAKDMLRG